MNLYNNNIKFMHFRNFVDGKPMSKGGFTIAYYEEGGFFTWAEAKCSKSDNFSRHEGRSWAVKRLRSNKTSGRHNFKNIQEFRTTMERYVGAVHGLTRQYGKKNTVLKNEAVAA